MKRYAFRLAGVLRVRRTEQDLAQGGVLRALAAAAEQRDALAEREQAYARALDLSGQRSRAKFVAEQAHGAALAQAVLDGRRALSDAEDGVTAARAAWTVAATRVGALERLDERDRAAHSAAALREDEMVVDDLVVSRSSSSATGSFR